MKTRNSSGREIGVVYVPKPRHIVNPAKVGSDCSGRADKKAFITAKCWHDANLKTRIGHDPAIDDIRAKAVDEAVQRVRARMAERKAVCP